MNDSSGDPSSTATAPGRRRRGLLRTLAILWPWRLASKVDRIDDALDELRRRDDEARTRLAACERRCEAVEGAVRAVQTEVERLRDHQAPVVARRLDVLEADMTEVARLRDQVVPAASARFDLLVDRLASELEEIASLVERQLRGEPLPVPRTEAEEREMASELAAVQPRLLDVFRGDEAEIAHRLDRYLPELRVSEPVLDLGCGRGELLLLLRETGVAASGVEGDPALAAAAGRRGLEVRCGDVLEVVRTLPDGSRGAVTALHLMEHLGPATLLALLAEVWRVLRPGGLLVAECPNPGTLRVGANEFWRDPTHLRPLPAETLALFLRATGFEVEDPELLHPFPAEQRLSSGAVAGEADGGPLDRRLERLEARLDDLLNGPRDYALRARRPASSEAPGADAGVRDSDAT